MMRRSKPPYLNGIPELLILNLLTGRAMHGYDIVQALRRATGNHLDFGEGCIYPVLHRLEAEGYLLSTKEVVGGRRRVLYALTEEGSHLRDRSIAAWQGVVQAVNRALTGGYHGEPLEG